MDPKNQFFERLNLRCQCFFDISRYLTNKYSDTVWGYYPPPRIPKWAPKNPFFEQLILGCQFFFISVDIEQKSILT